MDVLELLSLLFFIAGIVPFFYLLFFLLVGVASEILEQKLVRYVVYVWFLVFHSL